MLHIRGIIFSYIKFEFPGNSFLYFYVGTLNKKTVERFKTENIT